LLIICLCTIVNIIYVFVSPTERRCHLQHQVWRECGSACPRNCANYQTPPGFCSMSCVSGCFCRIPYVFHKGTCGICVLPKYC
ncbi:hypothetical protein PRIEUP_LOCUS1133, partial [Pristimantis euphronides]